MQDLKREETSSISGCCRFALGFRAGEYWGSVSARFSRELENGCRRIQSQRWVLNSFRISVSWPLLGLIWDVRVLGAVFFPG